MVYFVLSEGACWKRQVDPTDRRAKKILDGFDHFQVIKNTAESDRLVALGGRILTDIFEEYGID